MHILLLTAEYPPQSGGVGDYTRRLGLTLVGRGHAVSVMTIHDGRWAIYSLNRDSDNRHHEIEQANNALGQHKASWSWSCWGDVIDTLRRLRPDLLHIQYQTGAYGMHPAINFLPWRLRVLSGRPPIVVTFHDLLPPYLFPKAGPLRRWVTQRLACDADGVVVTNSADAEVLGRAIGGKGTGDKEIESDLQVSGLGSHVWLVPIGSNIPVAPPEDFEREVWRAIIGVQPGELLVAYFGLLGQSKGADLLLHAIEREPHWRLVLIGGEANAPQDQRYAANVVDQLQRRGLAAQVMRTGQLSESSVSAHLLAADVVALPFRDGASFRRGSLLAALAHGCAVVTTAGDASFHQQGPGPAEQPVLQDGVNALLVPPDDWEALYAAIKRVAEDKMVRAELGVQAQAVAAHFGWDAIAEQHEALYRKLKH